MIRRFIDVAGELDFGGPSWPPNGPVVRSQADMLWKIHFRGSSRHLLLPSSPPGGVRELLCKILPGCQPRHPATGYLAFFTLFLYLSALAGLARMTRDAPDSSQ